MSMRPIKYSLILVIFLSFVAFGAVKFVLADTVVRGFSSKQPIEPGTIVALVGKDSVEPVPTYAPDRIYGVAIDPKAAAVTVQFTNQAVFAATTGEYPVRVNDFNGTINPGDNISLSNTAGVGAKAITKQSYIVGKALERLNGTSGKIKVSVGIIRNPSYSYNKFIPSGLIDLSQSIAGKSISPMRLYLSLAAFLITLLIVSVLLFGATKSGLTALGRNPLSHHLIMSGITRVIFAASAVAIIGIVGVYLLLKL